MSAKFIFACLKCSLVAVFMLYLQTAFAQKKIPAPSSLPALDKWVDENKKLLGNDVSVLVALPDTLIYEKHTGEMAAAKTPSPIGASSQWLTTALLLQLADEGKLSLDEPVSKYLPVFEQYRRNYVTIRHCLTQETGLRKEKPGLASFFDKTKFSSLEEAVTDLLKKEIHANAGEQFRYSNDGFLVAARVAEAVTKKRFDQLIRTKLFVPLGMRNTSFSTDDGSAPNPGTGAKSTATDLARFLQMLLNNGKAGDRTILSETACNEMRKVQVAASATAVVPRADEGFAYALGCWAPNGSAGSTASVLALPGLSGAWPLVDFSKKYALVVVSRGFSGEQKPDVYMSMKQLLDQHLPARK